MPKKPPTVWKAKIDADALMKYAFEIDFLTGGKQRTKLGAKRYQPEQLQH